MILNLATTNLQHYQCLIIWYLSYSYFLFCSII